MSMHTAPKRLSIAAANAIGNTGSVKKLVVQHAVIYHLLGGGFVTKSVGADTGTVEKGNDTSAAEQAIGNGNSHYWKSLAGSVSNAGLEILAFWTLITLTLPVRTSQHIDVIRCLYDSIYGQKKWITSNFFVRTAIALKPTQKRGTRLTFSAESRQPDTLIEPPAKMKQEELL